jgi:type I restriction enzyme R subunit
LRRTCLAQGDSLRNKKDLVEGFIEDANITPSVDDQWKAFIDDRRESRLSSIVERDNLNTEVTRTLVEEALEDGYVKASGTTTVKALPPVSGFFPDAAHGEKKQRVLQLLADSIPRCFGLI